MQENKDIKKQKRKQKNLELTATLNPNKVNLLNIWKKYPKKVLWMFVSAFLYNIAIAVFLKKQLLSHPAPHHSLKLLHF